MWQRVWNIKRSETQLWYSAITFRQCCSNAFVLIKKLTVLLNGDANNYNDCSAYAGNKDIYDVSQ